MLIGAQQVVELRHHRKFCLPAKAAFHVIAQLHEEMTDNLSAGFRFLKRVGVNPNGGKP